MEDMSSLHLYTVFMSTTVTEGCGFLLRSKSPVVTVKSTVSPDRSSEVWRWSIDLAWRSAALGANIGRCDKCRLRYCCFSAWRAADFTSAVIYRNGKHVTEARS